MLLLLLLLLLLHLKSCTQGGQNRARRNPNGNEHTQISLAVLAHAHAINAGPIFSRVEPSPPERSEERRKNGARTGQKNSVKCKNISRNPS